MTFKLIGGVALAAAATLAAVGVSAPAQAQTAPVKIGFLGEFSGPQAAVGQDMYDGFMLVVERNGGKLGGVPVEILKEDSQLKPDVANQAVRRLVERDKVPIITGFGFSNIMLAVHKYVTDNKVFLLGANAGPSQIAGPQCSPYQFITSWQGDQAAEVVGQYAASKGYKRVVALAPNYQAGKDEITGFKRTYKGELADEIYTPLTQLDFSAELTQVASKNPDAVFAFYPGGLGLAFTKQYDQGGYAKKAPMLSAFTLDALSLPALGQSALGMISGAHWAPDFDNASNKTFVADFEKKYKRIPSSYAAQTYDTALLLDSALAKVKGRTDDKPALMAALKAADFQSVRGPFKFGNNNFPVQDFHVLEVAKDAQGRMSLKTISTPLKQLQDAYHDQCKMASAG